MDSHNPAIKHYLSIRRSVNRHIIAGFSILLMLTLGMALFSYFNIERLDKSLTTVVFKNNGTTNHIHQLSAIARERSIIFHRIASEKDPFVRDEDIMRYKLLAGKFVKHREALEQRITSPRLISLLEELKQNARESQPLHELAMSTIEEGNFTDALNIIPKALSVQGEIIATLESMAIHQQKINVDLKRGIQADISTNHMLAFIVLVIFMSIGIFIGVLAVKLNNRDHDHLSQVNKVLEHSNMALEEATKTAMKANETKTNFIANISHELRTPLTSIKGSVGMLNSGMFPNIDAEVMSLIKIADDNSDRLMALLEDVLDFSKLELGEIEIAEDSVDLIKEMDRALMPHLLHADKNGLNIMTEFDEKIPSNVVVDFEFLFKIIAQLLSNAIKFTEKGDIVLRIQKNKSDELEISVLDNGPGISPEELESIFDTFVQGDGSSTRKHGGTGLGLAICKKISDAMNGQLGAESTVGEGSRFWLRLPLKENKAAA